MLYVFTLKKNFFEEASIKNYGSQQNKIILMIIIMILESRVYRKRNIIIIYKNTLIIAIITFIFS